MQGTTICKTKNSANEDLKETFTIFVEQKIKHYAKY